MTDFTLLHFERPAMGSAFHLYIGGTDAERLERLALDALDRVDWLEQQLSHYLPESEISLLNAHAFREPVHVSPSLFTLLERLRDLSLETEAAFDCTAGKLVRAWGFYRRGQLQGENVSPPKEADILRIVSGIGWQFVAMNREAQTVHFLSPEIELHLGGVGKGYIVQCAADFLREQGVDCALLSSGQSSIAALGSPPGLEGWQISLANPKEDTPPVMNIALKNASLSTSGSSEQSVFVGERRISHLFDPRSGQPVSREGSVTILASDATLGDALATAAFVQGEGWTENYCASHPETGAIFVSTSETLDTPDLKVYGCVPIRDR